MVVASVVRVSTGAVVERTVFPLVDWFGQLVWYRADDSEYSCLPGVVIDGSPTEPLCYAYSVRVVCPD